MDGCRGGRKRPDPNCVSSPSYNRITRDVTDGDRDAVAREPVRIGHSAADGSPECLQAQFDMVFLACEPLLLALRLPEVGTASARAGRQVSTYLALGFAFGLAFAGFFETAGLLVRAFGLAGFTAGFAGASAGVPAAISRLRRSSSACAACM